MDQKLYDLGYHDYSPTPYDSENIVLRFQKRFDDEIGKRYFIDVIKWDNKFIPVHSRPQTFKQYDYEYEAQMYKKDTHDAVDFHFHTSWTIEMVEEFMKTQFETGLYDYYEKF